MATDLELAFVAASVSLLRPVRLVIACSARSRLARRDPDGSRVARGDFTGHELLDARDRALLDDLGAARF